MKRLTLLIFTVSVLVICITCRKYDKLMMVTTGTYSEITDNSVNVAGQVVDEGEGITQYGHFYSTTSGNTSGGTMVQSIDKSPDGEFTTQLTGLSPDTKYYTKAYVSNKEETIYGREISFTTLALLIPELSGLFIENSAPSILEMTYNLALANIIPDASSFVVMVNSSPRMVNTVTISGTKVQLTLASPVNYGDAVTVAYNKPATNQLQTPQGGQAESITARNVTNNVQASIPVYLNSVIENDTPSVLEMTYSLALANIVPATSAFTVLVNSAARSVNTVAINGTKVQLTLASPVNYGDVVTVAYSMPASNQLQTPQGGQATSITAQNVTNNVVLAAVPVYVSAVVEDSTPDIVEMTYDQTLANIVPASNAFTVLVNSSGNNVNFVEISDTKVRLTLAEHIIYGDIVNVSYTKPISNPLQTPSGGQAVSISNQSVINNTKGVPVVLTSAISTITVTTANSGGEVINDGGGAITQKGVCWSTNPNPTISADHTEDGTGTETFSSYLSGLNANNTYYLKAYATNNKGTGYGNELIFKTFTGTVKDIENNTYYTVTIGSQIWMAQNLKTTRFNDGSMITQVTDNTAWNSLTTPAFCWYNNDEAGNKNTYGALYNWYTVETGNLCPVGWHIPGDSEWNTLATYLGGNSIAGGKLKEIGFTHWSSPNTGATNESGFTSLPGGYRANGIFYNIGNNANFWTSLEGNQSNAWYRGLGFDRVDLFPSALSQSYGYSVRCIKN